MVNSKEFAKRIERIMEYHDLNASSFAERIEVGRSSISHILSGRNKPSLDFVLSITKAFPEADLYWILNGKGSYPISKNIPQQPSQEIKTSTLKQTEIEYDKEPVADKIPAKPFSIDQTTDKKISGVIVLYEDGSFYHYTPSN